MAYIKITYDKFTQKLDEIEYALYENLWLLTIVKLALEYGENEHHAGIVTIVDMVIKKSRKINNAYENLTFELHNSKRA